MEKIAFINIDKIMNESEFGKKSYKQIDNNYKKEEKKLIKHVKSIPELEKEMRVAASNLEFEEAAKLRDIINRLQQKEIGLLKK